MANPVRPVKLDEIIGQAKVVENCRVLLESSRIRNAPLSHIMFSGPAGTGKTTFAQAIAHEKDTKLYIANASAITKPKDAIKYLNSIRKNDILFIDEIHRLPIKVAEFLYPVMEDFRYDMAGLDIDDAYSRQLEPFTVIGATTILGKVPKPLRSRFKHVEEFTPYNHNELVKIVHRVSKIYHFRLSDKVASTIARTCRGNPRNIVNRTEWIRDVMLSRKMTNMDINQLVDVLRMQGVDQYGLEEVDRRYLSELAKVTEASLNFLCSKLDLEKQTVQDDIEPYLIQLGFIRITKRGRMINHGAYKKYLEDVESKK